MRLIKYMSISLQVCQLCERIKYKICIYNYIYAEKVNIKRKQYFKSVEFFDGVENQWSTITPR